MRHQVRWALVSTIATPTLLLTGGADLYAPPPLMQMFAERIASAEAIVVPEAGHSTYWEQPEAFNSAVLNFIKKH
jgi:pimeloyl-ACP methyl ester carboxylesterase